MAMTLRTRATANIFPDGAIDNIDRGIQACLAKLQAGRPILFMHWVEVPGGRFGCHWDIELPGPETEPR